MQKGRVSLQEKLLRNHESIIIIAKLRTWAEERLRAHHAGDKERFKQVTASLQAEGEVFKKHCEMCKRQNILEHDPFCILECAPRSGAYSRMRKKHKAVFLFCL